MPKKQSDAPSMAMVLSTEVLAHITSIMPQCLNNLMRTGNKLLIRKLQQGTTCLDGRKTQYDLRHFVALERVYYANARVLNRLSNKSLRRIKTLHFYPAKNMMRIPTHVYECTELQILVVAKNSLCTLTPSISTWTHTLRGLDLSRNKLRIIPVDYGRLVALEVFHLDYNEISELPPYLFDQLSALRVFTISYNRLRKLPKTTFCQTDKLEEFDASTNLLTAMPPGLARHTNLQKLNLANNNHTYLHHNDINFSHPLNEALPHLTQMVDLDLSFCQLVEDALSSLKRMPNMRHLALRGNSIMDLKAQDFVGLSQLIDLDLSHNELQILPDEIVASLVNLQTLNLGFNVLQFLPTNIGVLTRLKLLNVKENELTTLPVSMADLINLCTLNISLNALTHFPRGMFVRLKSLCTIDLSHNYFSRLPTALFTRCVSLQKLFVYNNRFGIVQRIRTEILADFFLSQCSVSGF